VSNDCSTITDSVDQVNLDTAGSHENTNRDTMKPQNQKITSYEPTHRFSPTTHRNPAEEEDRSKAAARHEVMKTSGTKRGLRKNKLSSKRRIW
jgi:hypothetical protein